jgi:hypothetical protein
VPNTETFSAGDTKSGQVRHAGSMPRSLPQYPAHRPISVIGWLGAVAAGLLLWALAWTAIGGW